MVKNTLFDPWVGKIPWWRKCLPTPVFLLGEFHGQRSLAGYSPWGSKEWDMSEWLAHPYNRTNCGKAKLPTNRKHLRSSLWVQKGKGRLMNAVEVEIMVRWSADTSKTRLALSIHRTPSQKKGSAFKDITENIFLNLKKKKKKVCKPKGKAATAAKSLQSCPTLCDPIDGSPPGNPVPGILQTRILEWVAISISNAWKWKVKVKPLSPVQLLATPWTAAYKAPPSMGFSRQEYWSGLPLPSPS